MFISPFLKKEEVLAKILPPLLLTVPMLTFVYNSMQTPFSNWYIYISIQVFHYIQIIFFLIHKTFHLSFKISRQSNI